MGQMQGLPLLDQHLKRQRRLGMLPLGFGPPPESLSLRIDPLRDGAEPHPCRLARLIDREIPPYTKRLAHLAARYGIGPLRDEGPRPFRGNSDPQARTRCVEYQPILPTVPHCQVCEKSIRELWHRLRS